MRRNPAALLFVIAFPALLASPAFGDVKLHGLFTDHMVTQRDQKTPVWGTADPGEKVSVSLGDRGAETKADADGKWSVALDAQPAGGPLTLTVQGKNKIERKDVLVGEVWLCSGQSNMAWKVARAANAEQEIADAKHPRIRSFNVPRKNSSQPESDVAGQWTVCAPDTVAGFSATAYFFGRELHKELGVPVGLINSSVGGTPIEAWTSLPAQQAMFKKPAVVERSKISKITAPAKGAAVLYNGMIAPLVPYAIRGAIWYQGERNSRFSAASEPWLYRHQLPTMIANWRADWNQGDFPFLWAQLPNFRTPQQEPVESDGWVMVREGMFQSLSVKNTGMAVTVDIGEERNIHPANKQDVGKRLAVWTLAKTYGKQNVASGPLYRSMTKVDGRIVLKFDNVGGGLTGGQGGSLQGFAVAGEDRKFVWAEAKIVGETVEVSSPKVKSPVAARYAWATNPKISLTNKEGLPASPFRTDAWRFESEK